MPAGRNLFVVLPGWAIHSSDRERPMRNIEFEDRVTHKEYGEGIVLKAPPDIPNESFVAFDNGARKWIMNGELQPAQE